MTKKFAFLNNNEDTFPEWEQKTLGEVAEKINKGFTPSTDNASYWQGEIPWLSIAGFNKKYINSGTKCISKEALGKKSLFPKGSLVMSFKLTLGKLGILESPMMTNEAICSFEWKANTLENEYAFYALDSIDLKPYANQAAAGLTLNDEALKSIVIPLPSLPEQAKIAEFFSALDERIELVDNKVRLLKEQKKGYLQRVFAQEMVFTDGNGDTFPKWEQKKLGEVAMNNSRKYDPLKSEEEYRSVELENLTGGGSGSINGWFNSLEQKSIKNVFNAGDILLGKLRPYLKKWAQPDFEGVCSTEIWVLKSSNESISNRFLYVLIQSPRVQQNLIDITSGTKMPRADWKSVASTKIALPSLPEQEKITEFFSALDEQIELNENKLALLKEQKKGYLQGIFG